MKRFHVHVSVSKLNDSIGFYSHLFGMPPAVEKPDYAKWMLEDPRINFVISQRGNEPGVNHLGFQVDSDEELLRLRQNVEAAGLSAIDQIATPCCYAVSNKHWVQDPQGVAWETFHTLGSIPVFGDDNASVVVDNTACCVPEELPQAGASNICLLPTATENDLLLGVGMGTTVKNILILCTGNSARSILAEALFNTLPQCEAKFKAYSAGSFPVGRVNPFALELLSASGVDTSGFRSKSWDEFTGADAPVMDYIITVCDQAAGEQCPFWQGKPVTAHWGIPDPAGVEGSDDDKRAAFKEAKITLQRRIELFASLPLDKLDELAVKAHMAEIGTQ